MKYYRSITLAPVLLLALSIFIESSQSKIPFLDGAIIGMDKVLHFCAFFVFGLFLQFAVFGNIKHKRSIYLIILLGAIFGLSDEYHQSFVPGRDADVFDWIADVLGVLTSLFLLSRVKKLLVFLKLKLINNS